MFTIEQRDEQLLGTSAEVRYHLFFDRAPQHLLRVRMEIDSPAVMQEIGLPVWIPGSYKVREFSTQQGNVRLSDQDGNAVSWHWTAKNTLQAECSGVATLVVEYVYYSWEPGIRGCNISRNRAFINPSSCLMYASGKTQGIHHVYLHHNRDAWRVCSTPLSPVSEAAENEPLLVGALNYDILVDSPLEIGNHIVTKIVTGSSITEIAIIGNTNANYDAEWLTQAIERIVTTEANLWGELPYDRYVFMIQLFSHARSGLEHARCSVNGLTPGLANDPQKTAGLLNLLVHEFFHTWNVKRLRPAELGPFDYNRENYTSMLWLAEGLTSYYDSLLTYRCGFYDSETYLQGHAKEILAYYLRSKGKRQMSIKDSSFLAWVKLYFPLPDSGNRFTSYYQHGALLFMLLDLWILGSTNGEKALDDCLPELWKLYKERPEQGVTQLEVLDCISQTVGFSVNAQFSEWLETTETIDINQYLLYVGLQCQSVPVSNTTPSFGAGMLFMPQPRKIFCGFSLKNESGKIIIDRVEDDTPAAAAGFGTDDEIIAINGERVSSVDDTLMLLTLNGTEKPAHILASCDGILFETNITPEPQKEFVLSEIADCTPEQRHLRDIWLRLH